MRSLASKPNVIPPTSNFPFGRIKNDTGNNDGVPVDEQVYGDFHQFFSKLMADAGISPNNQPEDETNGFQLNRALFDLPSRAELSFNGVFSSTVDKTIQVASPNSISALDADNDNLYIANFDGAVYNILKYDLRTEATQTFIFTSGYVRSIAVDDTYIWAFIDMTTKQIVAFNKSTGTQDATKTITLPNASYGAIRSNLGQIYISDNTNNEVKTFEIATGSPSVSIGSSLDNIVDFAIKERFLFVVSDANNEVKVFDSLLGVSLYSFTLETSVVPVVSIEYFANKIHVLRANSSTSFREVYNVDTNQFLKTQFVGVGFPSSQVARIGGNKMFIDESNALNQITVFDQKMVY